MKKHHRLLVICAMTWMSVTLFAKSGQATCPQGQLEWVYWYNGAPHAQCGCTIENADMDPVTNKPIPWIVDRAAPVYFANKQFGTDWSYDLTQGVDTPWYYAAGGEVVNGISDGFTTSTPITPIVGPTLLSDTQNWIATKTVPVYVTGGKLNTTWKSFTGPINDNAMAACNAQFTLSNICANFVPPTESPGQCKKWTCDAQTGSAMIAGVENGGACDDGNACTTGETCSWGACQNGALIPPPPGDACSKPSYCDPKGGYVFSPAIQCAENQYCDKFLEACVAKPEPNQQSPNSPCLVFDNNDIQFGSITVKTCDKIMFNGNGVKVVVTIEGILSELGWIGMKVQANVNGSPTQFTVALINSANFVGQHKNLYGLHMEVLPSSFKKPIWISGEPYNYVEIGIEVGCDTAIQLCKINTDGKYCDLLCNAAFEKPLGLFFDVAAWAPYEVAVSVPIGYKWVAKQTKTLADCVRSKFETLFGIADKKPTTIAYQVDNNNNVAELANCHKGWVANVVCDVSPELSDTAIANTTDPSVKKAISKIYENVGKAENGTCIDEYGTIGQDLSHEMAHNFALNNFSVLNSEGLATFSEFEVSTNLNQSGDMVTMKCGDTGYTFSNGLSGTYIPKIPSNISESLSYFTGACFFRELRDTYGPETFKKIFQYAHTLKIGKYHLFKDIIHPIVNDNFYDKVKTKYGFTEDPLLTQSVQHFFD